MVDHEAHGSVALSDAEAEAEALFRRPCAFAAAAGDDAALLAPRLPEIAFAGRSNVGKSSVVNALLGQRIARTSQTPGRTRTINFFDLDGRLMVVDLPGYGHAEASRAERRAWSRLVDDYLRGRSTLRRVVLLIDARRGASDDDRRMMVLLDAAAVVYQAVLTKADAVKPGTLNRRLAELVAELARRPAAYPAVVATSARSGVGIARLRVELAPLAIRDDSTRAQSALE